MTTTVLDVVAGVATQKTIPVSAGTIDLGVSPITNIVQSFTAASANKIAGTVITLPTSGLRVGSRFRFEIKLDKTAAGVATWTIAVKFGTNNTTADAAIASWTSGTNTALIDNAWLVIHVEILTLGAAATCKACALYTQIKGAAATGLGSLAVAPTSTAAFNSAATSPFLHVDITPGASAVMSGAGAAECTA